MLKELLEFYDDSEIFITGGSGVVGKALIEKLLRSSNVRRIYLLLRPRKQLTAEQRLIKLRQAKIFEVLREQRPSALDKLVAVQGDVSLPLLGISSADAELMSGVSLVYHCAATIRFDEPLRVALQLNVGGTLEALKFAETLQQLRVFVHVSTFFSNPYLKRVDPKWYPAPMDWRKCLQLIETIKDDAILDTLTSKLIVGFPNTYTFTKNLAESLINDYRHRLPLIVYRPSVVLFAVNDPIPGYAPSLTGALGLFTLVGAGVLKTVYQARDTFLDFTPQDIGIKSLIYYTHRGYEKYQNGTPDELPIYMTSYCNHVPLTFKQIAEQMDNKNLWFDAAFEKNLLLPGCVYTDNRWLYMFLVFTKQIIPAMLADLLMIITGHPPAVMAIVRRAYATLEVMKPFLFNSYDSPGITEWKRLVNECRGTDFDLTEEVENAADNELMIRACRDMLQSMRRHLLNENPSTLLRSQRIMKIKMVIYRIIQFFLLYKVLTWLWHWIF